MRSHKTWHGFHKTGTEDYLKNHIIFHSCQASTEVWLTNSNLYGEYIAIYIIYSFFKLQRGMLAFFGRRPTLKKTPRHSATTPHLPQIGTAQAESSAIHPAKILQSICKSNILQSNPAFQPEQIFASTEKAAWRLANCVRPSKASFRTCEC